MINIANIDKVEAFRRLYNAAKPHNNWFFDYVFGRVMKVDLSGDTLDPRLYDRDNGKGAARRALGDLVE